MIYRAGSTSVVVAPSLRQSVEVSRRVRTVLETAGAVLRESSATRLVLANGSTLVALPGTETTTRGVSAVSLLVVDEAARVPDDLYFAIVPMTATVSGRIFAASTPDGRGGWWASAWHDQAQRWRRVEVPATGKVYRLGVGRCGADPLNTAATGGRVG